MLDNTAVVRYTFCNAMKNRSNSAALHREPLVAEKGRAKRDEYGLERRTEIPLAGD